MRVAISADGEMINRNFLDSVSFRLYDIEGQKVLRELTVPALGEGQDALIQALTAYRANVLICGGVSGKTRVALGEAGILTFGGIIGKAETAIDALLAGTLSSDPEKSDSSDGCSGSCEKESCKNCQFKK